VLRFGESCYQICGYHNLIGQKHTHSTKGALSYSNVLKPIIIRKGSIVQNAEDTSMTPRDYRMLYKFSHITICGFVNKIKKHFTILMTVGVPGSYILRSMDIISTDTFFIFISQGMILFQLCFVTGSWSLYFTYVALWNILYFIRKRLHILCSRVSLKFGNWRIKMQLWCETCSIQSFRPEFYETESDPSYLPN
jgi:hypothetical protein